MKADDYIDAGLIRESDLDGEPPGQNAAEVGPFGRYLLLEELGRGGAAIVYRALDPLLNRVLAMKRLRFGDIELEARFLREAELLARLSHPGIMPIFDFGREGDALYYTMPLASGLSLDRWIVERRPEARETARLVKLAAEALAHAHEHGVLHRDVKPANIVVSGDGVPLLADFGLGRIEDPKARDTGRVTESGEVMGTPSYMAPEFATGDLKSVDARCDVYSLGATLYEALTGRPPFIGRSSLEILKRVLTDEPVPPRRLAAHTPADLEIICLKALEKDPLRRYATSRELADDLGRFLAGEPIRARRATLVYRIRRFVARRRALVATALAGLVIAAGIGIYYGLREETTEAKRQQLANYLREAEVPKNALDILLREHPENHEEVRKQRDLALAKNERALSLDPNHAEAYYQRGRIHALIFEKEDARRNYDLAIQKGPIPQAHLERAILDSGDVVVMKWTKTTLDSRRLETLREGIRADLKTFQVITRDQGDMDFANALLEISALTPEGFLKAAEILQGYSQRSRDWRAYYWKGVAEMESGQVSKARESLETALKSRSKTRASADLHNLLGGLSHAMNLTKEAQAHFRRAVDLDDRLITAKGNLAGMLMYSGQLDESIQLCNDALVLDSTYIQAHAIRGQAYVMKHEKAELQGSSPANRQLLESAKQSLKEVRDAFPKGSEQAALIQKAWSYVVEKLSY